MYIETKYVLYLSFTISKICRALLSWKCSINILFNYYKHMPFLWYGTSVQYHPSIQLSQFYPRGGHVFVCVICFVARKTVLENIDPGWPSSVTEPSLCYHRQLNKITFFFKRLKFALHSVLATTVHWDASSLVIPVSVVSSGVTWWNLLCVFALVVAKKTPHIMKELQGQPHAPK